MKKKETKNLEEIRIQNYEANKMNSSKNSKKKKTKDLPWWVELLFVQVGLPDSLLIKILKAKRNAKELIKNDKNLIIYFFFIIATFIYIYPVIRQAKNKLYCEKVAENYIIKNNNLFSKNKSELKMLSTNFCNGGQEIYKIEN